MTAGNRLVGDIGGTRARFALLDSGGTPGRVVEFAVAEHAGPEQAIAAFLDLHGVSSVDQAAIAIAAPITGDSVRLTNAPWVFSSPKLTARFGLRQLLLLNDFAALALALPDLPAAATRQVGGGTAVAQAPCALIGPGTGLGTAALLTHAGRFLALAGEGGHVSLAPADPREAALLALAWRESAHVGAEDFVSGHGLPRLHRLLGELDGRPAAAADAEAIVVAAIAGDPSAVSTVEMFCGLLGSVAGNLALTFGARGGVFVGGGIVPRLDRLFDASPFRARFEAKGEFADYLRSIPTRVITAAAPALLGAARALDDPGSLAPQVFRNPGRAPI